MALTAIQDLGLTRAREVVLKVIRDSHEHLTANEVFAASKDKLPTISFATVYNSLRFLKDGGHIAEIQFGNGASRFDGMTHRHDHACWGSVPRRGLDALSLRPRHSRGSSNTALKAMKMMTPMIAAKNTAWKETVDSIMSAPWSLPPPRTMQ